MCLVAASVAFPAIENQQQLVAVDYEPIRQFNDVAEESDDLEGAETAYGGGGYGGGFGGGYGEIKVLFWCLFEEVWSV